MLIAFPFSAKARKWVLGRIGVLAQMKKAIAPTDKVIWMHCASLGEFEQGRPVLEKLKEQYPSHKILLTFFSPSGYEVQKNYSGADWVFYLPMDGPINAKRFLNIARPSLIVFVKYEFWYFYLKKAKYRNIPLLLIAALFLKEMSFFKWHGGISRKMLTRFDKLFVQDNASKELLLPLGLEDKIIVGGDTRFDRVIEIALDARPIEKLDQFIGGSLAIVAGSTWPSDITVLSQALEKSDLKIIIAPHVIDETNLVQIEKQFPGAIRYSNLLNSDADAVGKKNQASVLIIDNYGMLSRLYRYGTLGYIGGGFTKSGIHNSLEAAVYGIPVLFGPNYNKYTEAIGLIKYGGAISIASASELKQKIDSLVADENLRKSVAKKSSEFVGMHKGSTNKILSYIQENRLLNN
jgi:3-deoxy-D-manno-octulosonic-acid transferase